MFIIMQDNYIFTLTCDLNTLVTIFLLIHMKYN